MQEVRTLHTVRKRTAIEEETEEVLFTLQSPASDLQLTRTYQVILNLHCKNIREQDSVGEEIFVYGVHLSRCLSKEIAAADLPELISVSRTLYSTQTSPSLLTDLAKDTVEVSYSHHEGDLCAPIIHCNK